jgi:hypothetical protein
MVTSDLVDSNVFLRGCMLSLERFREQNLDTSRLKIAAFLAERRVEILHSLMSAVTVDKLCQESITYLGGAMPFHAVLA